MIDRMSELIYILKDFGVHNIDDINAIANIVKRNNPIDLNNDIINIIEINIIDVKFKFYIDHHMNDEPICEIEAKSIDNDDRFLLINDEWRNILHMNDPYVSISGGQYPITLNATIGYVSVHKGYVEITNHDDSWSISYYQDANIFNRISNENIKVRLKITYFDSNGELKKFNDAILNYKEYLLNQARNSDTIMKSIKGGALK